MKRILLLLMVPVFILMICGGVLYFLAVHRCRESIQYIVNRESKGRYVFDAGEAELSLRNKTLLLKESVITHRDPAGARVSYRIKIHELYFSLHSWRDLFLHQKLVADSLSIVEPDIHIQVNKTGEPKGSVDFRASDLLTYLEKTLAHFNVHAFTLKEGKFTYARSVDAAPLQGSHLNLSLSNFTGVNHEDSHLLGSDKVVISMGPQHWVLPDGQHEINFSRLTFDSKGQRFELDSFRFYQKARPDRELSIRADKFFFTSQHLPAIYQKEELLLDTLTCINPVLTMVNGEKREKYKDSTERRSAELFKRINVKFITVIDGELSLQNDGRTQNTATRKANVRIFNLSINPDQDPSLHTDSIRINLKQLEFITKDSLFRLGIDEFAIRRNDVLFRNVAFGPTSYNRSAKGVMFTAPTLLLKDISIPDLLQKRLKASGGELYRPSIVVYDKRPAGVRPAESRSMRIRPGGKIALFYQTLHGMSELIDAPHFSITNGTASYRVSGSSPLELTIRGFNAHILLNQLFVSDSLVDIKHSIPDLRIHEMTLVSKGAFIHAYRFRFDGVRRNSWEERLQVSLANGTHLEGTGIFWKVFDWDVYQKTRDIQIDSLHADTWTVHTGRDAGGAGGLVRDGSAAFGAGGAADGMGKDLPVIRIGQFTIDSLQFTSESGKGHVDFTARELKAESIASEHRRFTWGSVSMKASGLLLEQKNTKVRIKEAVFDSKEATTFRDLTIESASRPAPSDTTFPHSPQTSFRLAVPLLRMKVSLPSSDLSQLAIPDVVAGSAELIYTTRSAKDTLTARATAAIQARELSLPGKTGKQFQVGEVRVDWKDGRLDYAKGPMVFSMDGLSGSFLDKDLTLVSPVKLDWRQLITKTAVTGEELHYKGKGVTVDAAGTSWDPSGSVLKLQRFHVVPNDSREEAFKRATWQNDYIVVKGRSLTLTGVQPGETAIHLNRLILDEVALEASRDKTKPFRHGVEKPMPTQLINAIPFSVNADSVLLRHCSVSYNEFSANTHKWSRIPFEDLNGVLLHVRSRDNKSDTLEIFATARLFDSRIRRFSYRESYGDSLSGFAVESHLSPLDLTGFSQVSIPMAAVSVIKGHADTLYSHWEGNRYAAAGTMNFYYEHLKIRVLNKEDNNRRNFLPVLKTWLANFILPDSRKRASAIFVERDREKFVFNYWVKAVSSGALSTVGVKKSRNYRKSYLKIYQQYSLPATSMDGWKK